MSAQITISEQTRRSIASVFGSVENYLTFPVTVYGTKKNKDDKSKTEITEKLKTLLVTTETTLGDLDNDIFYGFSVVIKFAKTAINALSLILSYDGKVTTKITQDLLMESKYSVNALNLGMGSPVNVIASESLAKLSLSNDPSILIFLDLLAKISTLTNVSIDSASKLPMVTRLDLDPMFTLETIAKHGINANENDLLYLFAENALNLLPKTLDVETETETETSEEEEETETETSEEDITTMTKKQLLGKCLALGIEANRSMNNDELRELLTVNV